MPIFNFLACSRRVLSVLSIAVFTPILTLAQTSTGPKSPGSATNIPQFLAANWSNTGGVLAAGGGTASASGNTIFYSGILLVTNFGFSIPPTDVVDGIEVNVVRASINGNSVSDNSVELTKNGGTSYTNTNYEISSNWSTTNTQVTYGDNDDLWGTTWTPAEINSPDFGFGIVIDGTSFLQPVGGRVDHITVTVHHHSTVMPITLSSFEAVVTNTNTVRINWTTASETKNDLFTVEKSVDGEHYSPVTSVEGSGNTTTPRHYQCEDRQPYAGKSYYRLKQTDFNGTYSYSHVVKVDYDGPVNPILVLLPNPGRSNYVPFRILGMQDTGTVHMAIYDLQGRMLVRQDFVVDHPGVIENRLELDAPLSAGLHIVKAGPGLQMTRKLLIRR